MRDDKIDSFLKCMKCNANNSGIFKKICENINYWPLTFSESSVSVYCDPFFWFSGAEKTEIVGKFKIENLCGGKYQLPIFFLHY